MTHANVYKVEDVGEDYTIFGNLRCNFEDHENGTKEEAAAFFRRCIGKDAAIEAPESVSDGTGRFYISVDFRDQHENIVRIMPIPFSVSSVEILV
jgi:hypothetical protein